MRCLEQAVERMETRAPDPEVESVRSLEARPRGALDPEAEGTRSLERLGGRLGRRAPPAALPPLLRWGSTAREPRFVESGEAPCRSQAARGAGSDSLGGPAPPSQAAGPCLASVPTPGARAAPGGPPEPASTSGERARRVVPLREEPQQQARERPVSRLTLS
ncbi:unnamed protein product [Prorocentrum cordatum]|uniref:Uncharacterized protein n=1 Tax=Prorocentrum cordatum TaxID=2364126 RepID=A0ABN9PCV7_9DINO|nr:unnamed protein product [Polarella glacialis]